MASADINGITIEYEERGHGEPVLLIMGLAGQLIDWPQGMVDLLVDSGFRVIRFDNRDSGLSTQTPGQPPDSLKDMMRLVTSRGARSAYSLDDMADDAAGLLTHLGIASAHLVGVSMGGMIAQLVAIRHPLRVASLVSIMSNTGDRINGRASVRVLRKLVPLRDVDRSEAALANTEVFAHVAGSAWDRQHHLHRAEAAVARAYRPRGTGHQLAAIGTAANRTAALGKLIVPTLVLHGLQDKLVLPSGGIATAKAIVGSRLLMFPDMGHDLPRHRVPEMVAAITANATRSALSA